LLTNINFFRVTRLLEKDQSSTVYIHSVGSGIPIALNLALQLQKSLKHQVTVDSATSFVDLTGMNINLLHSCIQMILIISIWFAEDFGPLRTSGPKEKNIKSNAAIHLKIFFNQSDPNLNWDLLDLFTSANAELVLVIKMFFHLHEVLRWLGLTIFEIWIALVSFTIFTILLTLKASI